MATTDTKRTLMMAARAMVQLRGYNSLSYRELGKEVGIKSSSIHYYFPNKGNLGAALAHEYTDDFLTYLNEMLHLTGLETQHQRLRRCVPRDAGPGESYVPGRHHGR